MTALFYGIDHGKNEYYAVLGATTTSKDVEIVINDVTKVTTREDLLLAIEKLEGFITRSDFPPATS